MWSKFANVTLPLETKLVEVLLVMCNRSCDARSISHQYKTMRIVSENYLRNVSSTSKCNRKRFKSRQQSRRGRSTNPATSNVAFTMSAFSRICAVGANMVGAKEN